MTELEDIDGIGPSYAEELEANGYESAEDVASADADELDDVLDTHSGDELLASAEEIVDSEEESVSDDEYHTVDFDIGVDQRNHLIKGLVNEEIRARRTNKAGDVESVQEAIEEVIDGEPYEFTKKQLDTAYRAVNQLESEYRSQRGVGNFTTKIRNLKDNLQSARADAHPDSE